MAEGIKWTITENDIILPEYCPALGIRLHVGNGKQEDGSYSIDRINPKLGYVPGNVIVVSALANRMKNSATVAQLRAVASFYTRLDKERKQCAYVSEPLF